MVLNATHYPDRQLIDYGVIRSRFEQEYEHYVTADPFPHAMFEGFIDDEVVDAVLDHFPQPSADINWRQIVAEGDDGEKVQYRKQGMPHLFKISPIIRQLIWELNSSTFIRALEKLTGINNLIADPSHRGGGLHQVLPGGVLGVHADFTHHKDYNLERRINLLIYLNRDWQDDYEGHLELWNRDASRCVKRIRPLAGRCVIFNTDASSYHGHPRALACPDDVTRKSIAIYYYTVGRDGEQVEPTARTDWQVLPDVGLPPLI